jgi:hypothetical protein
MSSEGISENFRESHICNNLKLENLDEFHNCKNLKFENFDESQLKMMRPVGAKQRSLLNIIHNSLV